MFDVGTLSPLQRKTLLGMVLDSFQVPGITEARTEHLGAIGWHLKDAITSDLDVSKKELVWLLLGVAFELQYGKGDD